MDWMAFTLSTSMAACDCVETLDGLSGLRSVRAAFGHSRACPATAEIIIAFGGNRYRLEVLTGFNCLETIGNDLHITNNGDLRQVKVTGAFQRVKDICGDFVIHHSGHSGLSAGGDRCSLT